MWVSRHRSHVDTNEDSDTTIWIRRGRQSPELLTFFPGDIVSGENLFWLRPGTHCLEASAQEWWCWRKQSGREPRVGSAPRSNEIWLVQGAVGCCHVPCFIALGIKLWSLWVFCLILLLVPVMARPLVFHRMLPFMETQPADGQQACVQQT